MTSRTPQRKFKVLASFVTMLLVFGFAAPSMAEYPTKLVNLIVNYGPGGGTDLPSRALSSVIAEFLGQPMVVINKPGGGAQIGSTFVAKSRPDGHTLLIS